ncbi:hypothetical protein C5O22_10935 [Treponema sp. J25]|nr:hypothetical protein C5O22_10935 [Treponema sp. J25]
MNHERFFSFILFGVVLILHFFFFSVLIGIQKFLLPSPLASSSSLHMVLTLEGAANDCRGSVHSHFSKNTLDSNRSPAPPVANQTTIFKPVPETSPSLSLEGKEIPLAEHSSIISDVSADQREVSSSFLNAESLVEGETQSNLSAGNGYTEERGSDVSGGPSSFTGTSLSQFILRQLEARKVYPLRARQRGLEGRILLRFTVLPTGNIRDLTIEAPEVDPILIHAARRLVEQSVPFTLPSAIREPVPVGFAIEYRLTE